jgi:hypothetical protein
MLTLFATPKPFEGHSAVIQRNALQSWLCLGCEVLLLGDDAGVAETAAEFGAVHVPGIARNEHGTPLINDIFAQAHAHASYDTLCYINADIILLDDFLPAVERLRAFADAFLMVGQRYNMDITEPMDFAPGWVARLRAEVAQRGTLHRPSGIDYFVFPRGLYETVPAFAVGRPAWDSWMLYAARARRAPLVDATAAVMVVHQNHDYAHVPQTSDARWRGPEGNRNFALAGGPLHDAVTYCIKDASHRLTQAGVERAMWRWRLANPPLHLMRKLRNVIRYKRFGYY